MIPIVILALAGVAIWKFAPGYGWRLLVALDQLANVMFLNGVPTETISARAAWSAREGKTWGCILCKVLDWISRGHCDRVIEDFEKRPRYVPKG